MRGPQAYDRLMIRTNVSLIVAKGNDVADREVSGAVHNAEHWRSQLADGLIYLIGKQ
ncbi:MAG: hypothetical protein ABI481_07505 [Pyrinomonadaceae bacterium]